LGEVVTCFKKLFFVNDCICLLGKDNLLYLYYTASQKLSAEVLYSKLASVLPPYMLPSFFVFVEEFPLNANGKIDRDLLLQIKPQKDLLKGGKIRGDWEERVAEAWRLVLGLDKIDREDNFFQNGGNSLKLIQVYNYLQKKYPSNIGVAELFAYPTVATLANFLSQKQKNTRNKQINYKRRASNLIDKVVEGEMTIDKAVEIFKKL
jgi:acyl carrier protein